MKIYNTVPDFISLYENHVLDLESLESYYMEHPDIFKEYFTWHCPKTPERLGKAIGKYPRDLERIRAVGEQLPAVLTDVEQRYIDRFDINLDLQFRLFVGGYGSNAFVEREIISPVYFAAEKLSPKQGHLEIIAAHEIGHIYHNALSRENGMDWSTVDWTHGLTSLYREGVATYLSQQLASDHAPAAYFSYDEAGAAWLELYQNNKSDIKKRFLDDVTSGWEFEKEREWFRLSGGSYFGYNRLGYYLGTDFVHALVHEYGEEEALTYWVGKDLKEKAAGWLSSAAHTSKHR